MFSRLTSSNCILCHAHIRNTPLCLCTHCLDDLPRIKNSCYQCGKTIVTRTTTVCGNCQTNPPIIDHTFSLFEYKTPIDYLIKQLKFHHSLLAADLLGKLLADQINLKDIAQPEVIIPIPLHYKRLRERGYNQALEMAKPMAKQLDIPLLTEGLIRNRHTRPQTECSVKERKKNLHSSFKCPISLPYKTVAIVDDVITTGTTINEAAKALKQQGIEQVYAWSAARTDTYS